MVTELQHKIYDTSVGAYRNATVADFMTGKEMTMDFAFAAGAGKQVAVDRWGRIIMSPHPWGHFEERINVNPTNHFHTEFGSGEPDNDYELFHHLCTFAADPRPWSLTQQWCKVETGGYIYSHQPFTNGRIRFRLKAPKASTAGTAWILGMMEGAPDEMALPGKWAAHKMYGGQYFLDCYNSTGELRAVVQNRNEDDHKDVVASFPADMDTTDFVIEIEKYEDICHFWLFTDASETLLASFIPLATQAFPFHPNTAIKVQNDGTGTVWLKEMEVEPFDRDRIAPRKTIHQLVGLGATETPCGYSCCVDKVVIRNTWSTPCTSVQVLDGQSTPEIYWEGPLAANASAVLDFGGMAFQDGLKLYAADAAINFRIKGAFP